MRFCVLILFCHLTVAFAQTTSVPTNANKGAAVADQLVGAWRLVSIETYRANGETIYPFYGKHPEGLLVYDRGGWMSVQIVSDPKPMVPTASSRESFLGRQHGGKGDRNRWLLRLLRNLER